MIKQVGLLKRNPALSHEQFVDHYEKVHAKIGEKYLKGRASRYIRRYLSPIVDPTYGVAGDTDYDIIMELWFESENAYKETLAHITTPEASAEIIADEEYLFDRSSNRFFTVTEVEGDVG
jgi:DNA-binding Lrp family transcriptional regulator